MKSRLDGVVLTLTLTLILPLTLNISVLTTDFTSFSTSCKQSHIIFQCIILLGKYILYYIYTYIYIKILVNGYTRIAITVQVLTLHTLTLYY